MNTEEQKHDMKRVKVDVVIELGFGLWFMTLIVIGCFGFGPCAKDCSVRSDKPSAEQTAPVEHNEQ